MTLAVFELCWVILQVATAVFHRMFNCTEGGADQHSWQRDLGSEAQAGLVKHIPGMLAKPISLPLSILPDIWVSIDLRTDDCEAWRAHSGSKDRICCAEECRQMSC